jgi:preprotein translocase subunit SecY
MAIRKIPVQYASSQITPGDFEQDMMGGNRQWIPLKLNASGVMPILCSGHVYTCGCGWFIWSDTRSPLLALLVYVRFWYNLVLQR